ncbi:MAG: hypothetical protein QOK42_1747 [Frankiaceae bacterium]|jgi:hypothetical protein|nr:hypothetical protein [Frankiaceae bacterium]
MGELDDALAGLRAEALAAVSGDFERVRRARRRAVARRAVGAALALALIGGGSAFALSSGGAGDDDSVHTLNPPSPSAEDIPTAEPSATPSVNIHVSQDASLEWTGLSLRGSVGTLVGTSCDVDNIECQVVVRATSDGGHSFGASVVVGHGVNDPDVQTAEGGIARSALETADGGWLFGPSLYFTGDHRSWRRVDIAGDVRALLTDDTGTVAVVELCTHPGTQPTGCSVVVVTLGAGRVESSVTYPLQAGETIADAAGFPNAMTVAVVAATPGQVRHLAGDRLHLQPSASPCGARFSESLAYDANGALALCGDEPPNGSMQTKELFRFTRLNGWTSLGDPGIRGSNALLYGLGDRFVAVPGRGPLALTTDEGSTWTNVLSEVDGESVVGYAVTESTGELIVLSNDGDAQHRQIWRSADGTHWTGAPIT